MDIPNDADQVDQDHTDDLPRHMVADAPEDDAPHLSAGALAPDHNDQGDQDDDQGPDPLQGDQVDQGDQVTTGEEDL